MAIKPLHLPLLREYDETHSDGSNAFIYSRFLVPSLEDFAGWAIFVDGDMVCREDIAKLWALRDDTYAVQVVKHRYQTISGRKYIGTPLEARNEDYPRKNWSSVILWNCAHPANRILTPEFVGSQPGSFLHRFAWLEDVDIGSLPMTWNWLVSEYEPHDCALAHYTLGVPGIKHYSGCDLADDWHRALKGALRIEGVEPLGMVARADHA